MVSTHAIRIRVLMTLALFFLLIAPFAPARGTTAYAPADPLALLSPGLTTRVSVASDGAQGNDSSYDPSISADGRYVAFGSYASNLVSGDTNGYKDIFVHDRQTGQTTRVSVASDGTQGNNESPGDWGLSISADGRYVAFTSFASNLVSGDTNNWPDVFVRDRQTGQTTRVSVASDGAQGNSVSRSPSISADGRYVAFTSSASNLVSGDTNGTGDVFIHDRQTGQTTRISLASDGAQGNDASYDPSISADGRYVAFISLASNLVSGDTNGYKDIFVHDRQTGQTTRVSVASDGAQGNGQSYYLSISADGRYVAFDSEASNLVSGDTNGALDTFVHDREAQPTTYFAAGRVTDGGGNPISEVTVTAGAGLNVTTDVSGYYTITNLISGTYTLTPAKSGWTFVPVSRTVSVPPSATDQDFTGASVDLSVDSVTPVQVLEGQDLVGGKATAVKAVIRKSGAGTASDVSARLTYLATPYTRFYVAEPANLDAQHALVADNTTYPLYFAASDVTKTIYFFGPGLAPIGGPFQASVTVDYLAAITETNEANNTTTSASVPVHGTQWSSSPFPALQIHYFRTDWGATPPASFDTYYQATNAFLQGVYPVSGPLFNPGQSPDYLGDTTPFQGSDGRLNEVELGQWIMTTLPQIRLAHPTADRFIATVPSGWFAAATTGTLQSVFGVAYPAMRELIVSEARTTGRPNGPSMVAHEIGHSYGLRLDCEEYDDCNPARQDGIGNAAAPGLWVDLRIPIQVPTPRSIYCFMGAYADREYWIDAPDYARLLNDHQATVALDASTAATAPAILAVGAVDVGGAVTLDNWYILPESELSTLVPGPYTFEYQDAGGGALYQQSFSISHTLEGGYTLTESPFVFTIPYVTGTVKIVVKRDTVPLAQKVVSPHTPTVGVTAPNGGERLFGQATIRWSGSDADGDTLSYAVLVSPDNGATWEPLAANLPATSYTWDVSQIPTGTQYLVKVIATDGINTGQDVSDASFAIVVAQRLYLPLVLRAYP